MCSAAAMVGGAVAQWAETQGKNDIFDTVDFSNADLLHMTEQDCLTNCTAIYNVGNANIAALTTAGTLTAATLPTSTPRRPCDQIHRASAEERKNVVCAQRRRAGQNI
jgi:hypothetical protein